MSFEEKCPWDRKQTFESLRYLTIEETYELSESLLGGDHDEIKSELGDLLLHVVFYAKIGSEQSSFDIADVANRICDKLIERHPHVYGDVEANSDEEVKQNWEKIKLKEDNKGVFEWRASIITSFGKGISNAGKSCWCGLRLATYNGVVQKIEEELREFYYEVNQKNQNRAEEEFGDLLFSLVNYARFMGINPDDALSNANQKFRKRFVKMESKISDRQIDMSQLDLDKWEKLWQEVKSEN